MHRTTVVTILLAVAMLCSCEPAGEPQETGPPPIPEQTGCRNARRVVEEVRPKATIRGDVDGDGEREGVQLLIDGSGAVGCRALVVVRMPEGVWVTGVDRQTTDLGLGLPALGGLVQVDSQPGLDLVVDVVAGASTRFVSVVSLGTGRLRVLRVRGPGPVAGGLFAYGGSVGHLDGVDCAASEPGDLVVTTSAVPRGRRYRVTSRFLRYDSGVLVADGSLTRRARAGARALGRRWPELAAPPFASCPT